MVLMFKIVNLGKGYENYNNSKKLGVYGFIQHYKPSISKLKPGDIIIFVYKKEVKSVAKFSSFKDKKDEPLINIETETDDNLNWKNAEKYTLQIKFSNLIEIENLNFIKSVNFGPPAIQDFNEDKHIINSKYNLKTIIEIKYNLF